MENAPKQISQDNEKHPSGISAAIKAYAIKYYKIYALAIVFQIVMSALCIRLFTDEVIVFGTSTIMSSGPEGPKTSSTYQSKDGPFMNIVIDWNSEIRWSEDSSKVILTILNKKK